MSDIKPINHLFESAHNFGDGVNTAVNLIPHEWSHFTVTDGDWMTQNTLKPLYWRDMYLANTIDDYAKERQNFLIGGVGVIINNNSHTISYNNLAKPIITNYPIKYSDYNTTGAFNLQYVSDSINIGSSKINFTTDINNCLKVNINSTITTGDSIVVHCKNYDTSADIFETVNHVYNTTELYYWAASHRGIVTNSTSTLTGSVENFPSNANIVVVKTNTNKLLWTEHSSAYKEKGSIINGIKNTTQYDITTYDEDATEISLGDWSYSYKIITRGLPNGDSVYAYMNYNSNGKNFVPDEVLFIY